MSGVFPCGYTAQEEVCQSKRDILNFLIVVYPPDDLNKLKKCSVCIRPLYLIAQITASLRWNSCGDTNSVNM